MSDFIPIEDFADPSEPARDFRRANGAPMVKRPDGSGRWDRYSRPSAWGEDLDEQSALVNWRIDRAIEGVARDPALRATIAANLGIKEGAEERRNLAINRGRGDQDADIGTALHAMSHRIERGDDFVCPPPYDADMAAYLSALDRAGLVSRHIECHLCSDEWRAAGTADRIYEITRPLLTPDGRRIEVGQFVIGDLKTGKLKDYSIPSYVIQLAIYCDSVFYDVATDERSPLPDGLRTDWGLLVRMPAGTATVRLEWADLNVGREGAAIVRQVRSWRKRSDFIGPLTWPVDDEVAVMSISPDEAVAEAMEAPPPDEWVVAMTTFAQQRIDVIGGVPEARALLLRQWPAGCPPPAAGCSAEQLTRVLTLLDAVEAAYHIPWPAGDPRVGWSSGQHRSEIETTNQGIKEP